MPTKSVFFIIYLSLLGSMVAADYQSENRSFLLAGGHDEFHKAQSGFIVTSGKDAVYESSSESDEDDSYDYEGDNESDRSKSAIMDSFILTDDSKQASSFEKKSKDLTLPELRAKFAHKPKPFRIKKSELEEKVDEFVKPYRDDQGNLHYHDLKDPNFIFEGGDTLLHYALKKRKYDIASQLISYIANTFKGAEYNALSVQNESGKTPLHIAIESHDLRYNIIEKLVNYGADIHIADNGGNTPLDLLKENHQEPRHHDYKKVLELVDAKLRPRYERRKQIEDLKKSLAGSREQREQLVQEKSKLQEEYDASKAECTKLREQISQLLLSTSHGSDSSESSESSVYTSSGSSSQGREDRLNDCINLQDAKIDELEGKVRELERYKKHYKRYKTLFSENTTTIEQAQTRLNNLSQKINYQRKLAFMIGGALLSVGLKRVYDWYFDQETKKSPNASLLTTRK